MPKCGEDLKSVTSSYVPVVVKILIKIAETVKHDNYNAKFW